MLYYIQPGDTLYKIAIRFNTTVMSIFNANVICNPGLIFSNQPIIIPEPGLQLPAAGGNPYYIVLPGDTLWCLANKFNTTVDNLVRMNHIPNPDLIFVGSELLVIPFEEISGKDLKQSWESLSENCDLINPLQVHGTLYFGSFKWEALDISAFPYLLQLLKNPCDIIRYYAAVSMGRIGKNGEIQTALDNLLEDPSPFVANGARLAIRRIELLKRRSKRIHITISDSVLFNEPDLNSSYITIPEASAIIVLKWHIPSPTGEEGPKGDIQMYDWVQDIRTGQVGYMPRAMYREIVII